MSVTVSVTLHCITLYLFDKFGSSLKVATMFSRQLFFHVVLDFSSYLEVSTSRNLLPRASHPLGNLLQISNPHMHTKHSITKSVSKVSASVYHVHSYTCSQILATKLKNKTITKNPYLVAVIFIFMF